jgi:peroxiredoxin Q/BCP
MPLRIGQKAPDFDVVSSAGKRLRLTELAGKKNLVLYFYPGDFTPVCTKETCGFNALFDELAGQDTEVVGVSVDSDESHRKFSEKYGLKIDLISDGDKELAKKYEATSLLRDLFGKTSRITYVIDKKGRNHRAGLHVGQGSGISV